ncbi:MAG: 50S ribosomal protein L29, partial [Nanoarchaeota archaeon]
ARLRENEEKVEKNKYQLKESLSELRKVLMKINSQRAIGTIPENPGNIKQVRRNIARVLTFMKQKSTQESIQEVKTEKK